MLCKMNKTYETNGYRVYIYGYTPVLTSRVNDFLKFSFEVNRCQLFETILYVIVKDESEQQKLESLLDENFPEVVYHLYCGYVSGRFFLESLNQKAIDIASKAIVSKYTKVHKWSELLLLSLQGIEPTKIPVRETLLDFRPTRS